MSTQPRNQPTGSPTYLCRRNQRLWLLYFVTDVDQVQLPKLEATHECEAEVLFNMRWHDDERPWNAWMPANMPYDWTEDYDWLFPGSRSKYSDTEACSDQHPPIFRVPASTIKEIERVVGICRVAFLSYQKGFVAPAEQRPKPPMYKDLCASFDDEASVQDIVSQARRSCLEALAFMAYHMGPKPSLSSPTHPAVQHAMSYVQPILDQQKRGVAVDLKLWRDNGQHLPQPRIAFWERLLCAEIPIACVWSKEHDADAAYDFANPCRGSGFYIRNQLPAQTVVIAESPDAPTGHVVTVKAHKKKLAASLHSAAAQDSFEQCNLLIYYRSRPLQTETDDEDPFYDVEDNVEVSDIPAEGARAIDLTPYRALLDEHAERMARFERRDRERRDAKRMSTRSELHGGSTRSSFAHRPRRHPEYIGMQAVLPPFPTAGPSGGSARSRSRSPHRPSGSNHYRRSRSPVRKSGSSR